MVALRRGVALIAGTPTVGRHIRRAAARGAARKPVRFQCYCGAVFGSFGDIVAHARAEHGAMMGAAPPEPRPAPPRAMKDITVREYREAERMVIDEVGSVPDVSTAEFNRRVAEALGCSQRTVELMRKKLKAGEGWLVSLKF